MKKQIAIVFMALLVLSAVPILFSQDSEESNNNSMDSVRVNDRANRAQEIQENRSEILALRVQARERAQNAKEKFRERSEDLRKLREECKSIRDSQDCKVLKENAKGHTKEFLLSAADRMLVILDKLLVRIENSKMNSDQKTNLTARVEAKIAAINVAREDIDALSEQSTRDEFKQAAQALRDAWSGAKSGQASARELAQESTTRVAVERFGGIVKQSEQLVQKLKRIQARLGASDANTSAFDAALAATNVSLLEMSSALDANDLPSATAAMRKAKESLAQARVALAEIVQELKSNYVNAEREITREATREAKNDTASERRANRGASANE